MITLHEIKDTYLVLLDILDSLEEADQEQMKLIEAGLETTHENFTEKTYNYTKFINSQSKDIEVIEQEIKRLNRMKKVKQDKIEYLKNRLIQAMHIFSKNSLEFPTFKLSIRKSLCVEVVNLNDLPQDYLIVNQEIKPDKNKIKEAIKLGIEIKGAYLAEKENLIIR